MAEDSKDKLPEGIENLPGVTTLTITRYGKPHTQQKDAQGKWLKKVKPLIPTVEFTRAERKFLNKARADGKTEYMAVFENMVRIAQYDGDDAKMRGAAVCAYKELRLSALGKPATSEVDMDKLQSQPFTYVLANAPVLPTEVVDGDKPKQEKKQPSFAEVVSIKND
jgi:hypothetical protein